MSGIQSLPRTRFIAFSAGLALLALHPAAARSAETLREALVRNQIPVAGREAEDLQRRISSYATLDEPQAFVIGYFAEDGSVVGGETLYVDLYRKDKGDWITRHFEREAAGEAEGRPAFGNSVVRISRCAGSLLLETHVNPSAAYTLVLGDDLAYRDSLYGWPLAVFRSGLVIYQNSEVHFAPTHYVEISVYNVTTGKRWLLYPHKPYSPVRQAQIEKIRTAYAQRGAEWFKTHNHHGNPELFDTFFEGEVAANEATHSLVFRIAFDNTDTWDYAEKLKFLNFGGLARRLADFDVAKAPPEGIFAVLGDGLLAVKSLKLQDAFLEVFNKNPETEAMLQQALASADAPPLDWQKYFVDLDARWARPEIWRRIQARLATPPPTTDVICVFRNLDQQGSVEYREMRLDDFQRQFGDRPLSQYLEAPELDKIFAP